MAAAARPLIAADGGANHLARLGLRPAAVVGDLDSIHSDVRTWLGEKSMVHRPDQDRTDLDKALDYVFNELGIEKLTVLAALGGRSDHDLANLGLLARLALGENLVFTSSDQTILAISGEAFLASKPGEIWSFWTFDPKVDVTIDGVRWPVTGGALDISTQPSISNEATSDEIKIRTTGGAVIVTRHYR
jgi:thiamine pyrophosphokinase